MEDVCTGGNACSLCKPSDLTDCECQCYDDCDGAYITSMRILAGFLNVAACGILCVCAFHKKKKKQLIITDETETAENMDKDKDQEKAQMDIAVNTAVVVTMNEKLRIGTVKETKLDDIEGKMVKVEFTESGKEEWVKKEFVQANGTGNAGSEEEASWKLILGCLLCIVCAIFSIILYADPLTFYPKEQAVSQEEKFKDWGTALLVFGCIGACCFLLCIMLTLTQKKMDEERIANGGSKNNETKESKAGETTMTQWIMRTIAMGICCTSFIIAGSVMLSSQ